jgi:two-component system, NtrC family, C4-dicarboxylate transport sensor histidine kinase DctB
MAKIAMDGELADGGGETLSRRIVRSIVVAGVVVISAAILWFTYYWSQKIALEEIRERSGHTLNLVVTNLQSELSKFQYQPALLANSRLFQSVLLDPATGPTLDSLNRELERVNFLSGALDTFLVNKSGTVVASSNWASNRSLVGFFVGAQPYFQSAMHGGLGRYHAISGPPDAGEMSYFFSYPIRTDDRQIGVVVIRLRLDSLEERWLAPDHEILVVDEAGVIFMSTRLDWRFRATKPLDAEVLKRLKRLHQYGDRMYPALPMTVPHNDKIVEIAHDVVSANQISSGSSARQFLFQQKAMPTAGWRVIILSRLDAVAVQTNIALVVVSFMLVSALLLLAVRHQRKLRLQERISLQEAAQANLEEQVEQRTEALTAANRRMRNEIVERHRAEEELHKAQEELVQSAKLAALGQMSVGLSHELNQPLAAIRSYSDNARTFLERAQPQSVQSNLEGISELTERMARIIRNLRTYARGEAVESRPTSLRVSLDEALNLLEVRFREDAVELDANLPDPSLQVIGGTVRLQQVFVNLISNGIDAMKGRDTRKLSISVVETDARVEVSIADTGAGINEEDRANIFDPFYSTKGVGEGTGLGLSISYGIINQFGGQIETHNEPDGGAVFTVVLKKVQSEEAAKA